MTMGFCDVTNAEVFAYTRARRAQDASARRKAIHGETKVYRIQPWSPAPVCGPPQLPARARRTPTPRLARSSRIHNRFLPSVLLEKISELQNGECYLCRTAFTLEDAPTQDHVVPRADKGGHMGNILLAHLACNEHKDRRPPTDSELAYCREIWTTARVWYRAKPTPALVKRSWLARLLSRMTPPNPGEKTIA